jgi:hypothetical protein
MCRCRGFARQRYTGKRIAGELGISPATVSRILRRLGLNSLKALEPAEPVRRYEREHPGELIHIDIKKLGRFNAVGHRITGDRTGQSNSRGVGWECLHLAIDDYSRLAYSELLADEKRRSCLRFLFHALRFFRAHGVKVQRIMTDNGSSFRSYCYGKALRLLLKPFLDRLGHKARRQTCPLYVSGLIGPGDRKSVQPMAKRLALGACDQLHHFIAARGLGCGAGGNRVAGPSG